MTPPAISLFLPSLAGGGAERVFVDLANGFTEEGLRVDLVLVSVTGPYVEEISKAVRIVDLQSSSVLRAIPKLARYLAREQPTTLMSALDHANVGAILARLLSRTRTRCVISMRSVPRAMYRETRSVRTWVLLQLMRLTYPFADSIVANSRAVATDLSRLMGSDNGITVIYNPLNVDQIERLSRQEIRDPWGDADGPPVVLGVGRLSEEKDFPTLVRAFSLARARRACRLVILGEGPERDKIEALLRELQVQGDVYMPGFVNNPFPWMRRARVFVSSSVTEGCPNALMQALACGTAVVGTNEGGSAEILEGGKWGGLVSVGDCRAMSDAILVALGAEECPPVRRRALDFAHGPILRRYLELLLPNATANSAPS